MASVMEIRGTTYPSFFIGKQGPVITKSGSLNLSISAVVSNTAVSGGFVNISGGANTSASGNGGIISLSGGMASVTTGTGGLASLIGGAGAVGSLTSHGGGVSIIGGAGGGNGGSVTITSGVGANAGNISVIGANSSAIASTGGSITIAAGNGDIAGGDIHLVAGNNTGVGTTGSVIIGPSSTVAGNAGEIRFEELISNGINYVGLKAPDLIAANTIWTLPTSDGTAGQSLATDGLGAMYWQSTSTATVPYEVYATTPVALTNVKTKIPFTTERMANPDFSIGTNKIIVNKAGIYTVEMSGTAKSTNTTRTTVRWFLHINNIYYPSGSMYSYHRTTTGGKSTVTKTVLVNAIVGTTIDLRCKIVNGSGAATLANECHLLIRGS